jgi:hypothetical protein
VKQKNACKVLEVTVLDDQILILHRKLAVGIARAVFSAMEVHMETCSIVENVCVILGRLSSYLNQGLTQQGIRLTVQSMRNYQQNLQIQLYACRVLGKFAFKGYITIAQMWAEGALPALVASMELAVRSDMKAMCFNKHSPNEETEQTQEMFFATCCRVIGKMYEGEEPQEEPGLTVLSRVIIKYMKSARVVQSACIAVTSTNTRSIKSMEMFGRQMIRVLLLVLRSGIHRDDDCTLTLVLNCLQGLVTEVPANAMFLAEDDALRILLQHVDACMQGSKADSSSVLWSLFGTTVLSGGAHVVDAMVKAQYIQYLAEKIMMVQQHDRHKVFLEEACTFLTLLMHSVLSEILNNNSSAEERLSKTVEFSEFMTQQGAIDAMIHAMPVIDDHALTQQQIIAAFAMVFEYYPENSRALGLRMIRAISQGMLYCADSKDSSPQRM